MLNDQNSGPDCEKVKAPAELDLRSAEITQSIRSLERCIGDLNDRLVPVMHKDLKDANCKPCQDNTIDTSSPLIIFLKNIDADIKIMYNALSEIKGRLDI